MKTLYVALTTGTNLLVLVSLLVAAILKPRDPLGKRELDYTPVVLHTFWIVFGMLALILG